MTTDRTSDDDREKLIEELKKQRDERKSSLDKLKRTKYQAIESIKKATATYDAEKLAEYLRSNSNNH